MPQGSAHEFADAGYPPEARPARKQGQLIAELSSGEKEKPLWRIGTEHEKLPFLTDTLEPVPYEGRRSIRSLLERMQRRFGWSPVFEGGNIIGLSAPEGGVSISLEAGGQFELSGGTLETLHETREEILSHLSQAREVGSELGIGFLGIGASPLWGREETPVMPKERCQIMASYLPGVGRHGVSTMLQTCTVQVNLDFSSEADMVKKLRVGLALQPLATALFANSPLLEGRPSGFLSTRSEFWRDTDNERAGMLPFVFEEGMSYERYVDYALDVPMYFVIRGGTLINTAGESFRDFLAGRLPQLPGEVPVLKDWADHLSTIFPEVRLRKYLEMRGADCGATPRLCALPALWVGLLYHQSSLDAAWDLVRDWSAGERQALRDDAPREAMRATIRGRSARDVARDVLAIAREGLKARGASEESFLDTLDETVAGGKSSAELLLEQFRGKWRGDPRPIFQECAY